MKVEVKYYLSLKNIIGKEVEIFTLNKEVNLREFIDIIIKKYGEEFKRSIIINPKTGIPGISILLNGISANSEEMLNRILKDNDTISFIPGVAGGSLDRDCQKGFKNLAFEV
jgi:MoaD family protein